MTYAFDVSIPGLIGARTAQWAGFGIPKPDIMAMRDSITDMWTTGPTGWTRRWSSLAQRYARSGDHSLAATAYGIAKFPALVGDDRRSAYANQLEHYQLVGPNLPVRFRREHVEAEVGGETAAVPVHVLSAPEADDRSPVLLASGGVDTWKMDQHRPFVAVALGLGAHIVAFDIPGTGELTAWPMVPDADALVLALVGFARSLTSGPVGHLGISFGGYFSARSGLQADVDAAVALGAPVRAAFDVERLSQLPLGTLDMIGNAMGFASQPDPREIFTRADGYRLDPLLLSTRNNAPMLVMNGDRDPLVPIEDTTAFEPRPRTEVVVVPEGSHCAVNKLDVVLPSIVRWAEGALPRGGPPEVPSDR